MNKLIVILGLVLLSTTNALAAKLQTVDVVKHDSTQTFNLPGNTSTQISFIEADRGNDTLSQESKLNFVKRQGNHQVIIAGYGDPDGRGTPGEGRGEGTGSR